MESQQPLNSSIANAWVVIAIEKGQVVMNVKIPLRWALIVVGAIASATGSPTVLAAVSSLLHSK